MKTRKLISRRMISLIAVFALFGSIAGFAGNHHKWRSASERATWFTSKITKDLKLNDEQKAKLDAVKDEFLAIQASNKAKHDQTFKDLIAQVKSQALDQAKLKDLLSQHHQAMEKSAPQLIAKIAEFHASLTDEQKATAAEKLEKFHNKKK